MGLGTFLGNMIGGATASGVGETLNGIADAGLKVREIITGQPSPEKLLEAQAHITDMLAKLDTATAAVNEAEAKSSSFFVAGWRPALGWVCSISVGMYYIPRFLLGMYFWSAQVAKSGSLIQMPEMGIQDIIGLVVALLGMATLRSVDKSNGVHNDH